jgi:N6-L-threonylcarbamoyladenine synthase
LKTAVLRWTESHDLLEELAQRRALLKAHPRPSAAQWLDVTPQPTRDVLAAFQSTVIEELMRRIVRSAEEIDARTVIVSGGVACNRGLRDAAAKARLPWPVLFPTPGLSTDNAAMIAAAAFRKLQRGEADGFELRAQANLTLA